jgi:hypothetical protein
MASVMKSIALLVSASFALVPLAAEPLSEADRQVLLKRLEQLRDKAGDHVSQRLRGAARDFAAAMKSDDATIDLYLQCVEKVDFEDRDRKSSDFRDWKRNNRERLRDEGFALVLRHQLRWAMLTIQAANQPEKIEELAPDVMQALDLIYQDPVALREHVATLSQAVTSTVFARAYGLNGYEAEGWPLAPLEGGRDHLASMAAFNQVIFPALRAERETKKLRDAWKKRIQFEEIARGFWSKDSTEEGQSLELDEFLADRRPALQWEMEEDLFRVGDQRQAALSMLKLLAEHITHPQARDWEQRFRDLIDPKQSAGTESEGM